MKITNLQAQTTVQKNRNQLWNFYISNNSVFYKIIENDVPIKSVKLIDNVKNYDIALDLEDNIHLACVKNDEELCYLYQSKNSWKKRVFKESSSKSCIDFINIKNINNTIHIFYTYKNNTDKEMYKIFHLYTVDEKWKYAYLGTSVMSKNKELYFVDYSENGDIFIIYQSEAGNRNKIYSRVFNHNNYTWSVKKELRFKKDNINIKNLLLDSKNNLHYIYVYNSKVSYFKHNFNNFKNLLEIYSLINSIDFEDKVNEDYLIFEVNNKLWISWKIEEVLYYIYSENFGVSWSEKEEFESSDIFSIKHLGCNYMDMDILKPLTSFGINKDTKIYLLGRDGNFFDQLRLNPKKNISWDDINITEESRDDGIIDTVNEEVNTEVDEKEVERDIIQENGEADDDKEEAKDSESYIEGVLPCDNDIDDGPIHCDNNVEEKEESKECEDIDASEDEEANENEKNPQGEIESPPEKSFLQKIKSFFTADIK